MLNSDIHPLIEKIPSGYSEGEFAGRRYGISKTVHNNGKSCKIFAEELGGTDFISLNFYQTAKTDVLNPCEMPEAKVIRFLREVEVHTNQ